VECGVCVCHTPELWHGAAGMSLCAHVYACVCVMVLVLVPSNEYLKG